MENIKLKYVGDKPTISQHGIYFNSSKPDKYIYLQALSHVVSSLIALGEHEKSVENFNLRKKVSDSQILDLLYQVYPNFDSFYRSHVEEYAKKLEHEVEEVREIITLSDEEREIFKNNFNIMQDYRIQRAKNKLVYEAIIHGCVEIILNRHVSHLKAIFTREFFHVFQSIKNAIESMRSAPETSLKFIETIGSNEIEIELRVKFFGLS
jgi:hypothetical protein